MRDEIFTFESFINWWGELIGMGSLEDQKSFGALHPQFWRAKTATVSMSMSRTFIGGAVCWKFESEAPATEEMLDRVLSYAAENS